MRRTGTGHVRPNERLQSPAVRPIDRGAPRQRLNPERPHATFFSSRHSSTYSSPSPDPYSQKCASLAEALLEEPKLEAMAKKGLEEAMVTSLKNDLRQLIGQMDADAWMYSSCTSETLRL